MKGLSQVLVCLNKLTKLELTGNPLCQKHKYRDRIITMGHKISKFDINYKVTIIKFLSYHTGVVDGKEVSDNERQFLVNWKAMRRARKKQRKQQVLEYHDQLATTQTIPTSKQSLYPPLTLPAFPPRQLPRRIKQHHQLAELPEPEDRNYVKLPHIVKTTAIDTKGITVDKVSTFKNPKPPAPRHLCAT